MLIVWISGLALIYYLGVEKWLLLKLFFVFLMTLFHFFLFFSLKRFEEDLNQYSERFFRIINEIPTILLLIIVSLVVFQPNI